MTQKTKNSILIIGGGLVGLSIAYEFSRNNFKVLDISKNRNESAGFVAAGMLATHAEGLEDELLKFGQESQSLIPKWIKSIEQDSNIKCGLKKCGIVVPFKNKKDYYLQGQGDPDLNYENIIELISNIKENKIIHFNIVEIDSKLYWPIGWTNTDKLYEYGAPISSLAIESNHNKYDDIYALKNFIKNYLENKFSGSIVNINFFDSEKKFYLKDTTEINRVYSTPILSLLTLSNSESHNFTAESIFKNASKTWNDNDYFKFFKSGIIFHNIITCLEYFYISSCI